LTEHKSNRSQLSLLNKRIMIILMAHQVTAVIQIAKLVNSITISDMMMIKEIIKLSWVII